MKLEVNVATAYDRPVIPEFELTAWAGDVYSSKAWKMQAVLRSSRCKQCFADRNASSFQKLQVQAATHVQS